MKGNRQFWLRALPLGATVIALFGVALHAAWRHVPDFYDQALALDPVAAAQASNELLQHAGALTDDAQRQSTWQALFTAKQINGWLAVDLPRNHPELLPAQFRDPRICLRDRRLWLACRWGQGRLSSVLSVKLDVQMAADGVLAIRVGPVRAGLLPIPKRGVLDAISQHAAQANVPIRWRRIGADPVAIVRLPPLEGAEALYVVRAVELHPNELFVSGQTHSRRRIATARRDEELHSPPRPR
jgi:hypothetical protein